MFLCSEFVNNVGLINLEWLNFDLCKIGDYGIENVKGNNSDYIFSSVCLFWIYSGDFFLV